MPLPCIHIAFRVVNGAVGFVNRAHAKCNGPPARAELAHCTIYLSQVSIYTAMVSVYYTQVTQVYVGQANVTVSTVYYRQVVRSRQG